MAQGGLSLIKSSADQFHEFADRLPGPICWRASPIPANQMLFRPEEVVLTSSAALVDNAIFREYVQKLTPVRFDSDAVNAMGAGIIKFDAVFPVLAADQQQKIDCSRYAELLIIVQRHGMEREAQSFVKSIRIFRQGVGAI